MKKVPKSYFFIPVVLFAILFFMILNKPDSSEEKSQYSCRETEGEYEVTLWNKEGEIIFSEIYPREPSIREITENILEIRVSVGSPASYSFYFDKKNSNLSEIYFNAKLVGNRYIAYMENGILMLSDIFQEDLFCMRIIRDFTRTGDPMSAVINIEMMDNENIKLTYFQGADYTELTEMIPIKSQSEALAQDVFAQTSQCIWGTWVIKEVWSGQKQLEENEAVGTVIQILPDSFTYGTGTSTELTGYGTEFIAIKEENSSLREINTFQELGICGDYYLMFYPQWEEHEDDIFPFSSFLLISETEMMIPIAGHEKCILEKVESYYGEEDAPLMTSGMRNVCYGEWSITEIIATEETEEEVPYYVGQTIKIDDEWPGFVGCRVFGRSVKSVDEIAGRIGIDKKNPYFVCYDFAQGYNWEQIICVDDMTAVLIRGKQFIRVKRISDPEEDRTYEEPI